MSTEVRVVSRAEEFFRHHDAKDVPYLREIVSDDLAFVDEIARDWMRGRAAFEAYLLENLPRVAEMHSMVEGDDVCSWGDVEVETFVLRQHYVLDGVPCDIEAPTTQIWHREGEAWKLALIHSIPLAPKG